MNKQFHIVKKASLPKGEYFYLPLSNHASAYPLQNIASYVLRYACQNDIKLPHMNLKVLKDMKESSRDRPYGRIPYALVLQSMEKISQGTGIQTWVIDRYIPGIYFPMEKFIRTIPKLNISSDLKIHIRMPRRKMVLSHKDTDIVLSLLSMENFALKKEHAEKVGHFHHLFKEGVGPYLIPKDIDTVYTLMNMATPKHAYMALDIIGIPNFLGGLIASKTLKEEKTTYIKEILKRYIEEQEHFLTAYHLIESTLTTEEIITDKDLLRYAILVLGYTRLLGTYGMYVLEHFQELGISEPLLLMLLTVIMEGTELDSHEELWQALHRAYETADSTNKIYAAYGIINMVHFTKHHIDVESLITNNPIPEDIPLHIKVHLLRILSRHLGKSIHTEKAIETIRNTIEEISDREGLRAFKGHLLRSLATILMYKADVPPSIPFTMYWEAIGLDLMHSSSSFGHWLITAPHAGIPYTTVKHTFTSIVESLSSVFRPKESIYLYGAMAEASLQYGHIEDFLKYTEIVDKLQEPQRHVIEKNILFRIKALYYMREEMWQQLETILKQWQSYGVIPYFRAQWEALKMALETVKGRISVKSFDHSSSPVLLYIIGKYTDNTEKIISALMALHRRYMQRDDPLGRAETHTYLYRLTKDTNPAMAMEHALASRFIYDELDGIPPQDIAEASGGMKTELNESFFKLLAKRYREKSRLLEVVLSAMGSSTKEDVMKHLLKGLQIPFTTAYGKYETASSTIEAIYSIVGVESVEDLNIPTGEGPVITSHPSTAFITHVLGDKKLTIYAEHRYAEDIFDNTTISTLRRFADSIINILDNLSIVEKAKFDSLTGLHSRWFLIDEAPRMWKRTLLDGHSVSLIFIDIDNFKYVNDIYGHSEGDKVLRLVSSIITEEIRISDRAIRYGGDEFLIILPYSDSQSAYKVSNRIQSRVRNNPLLRRYMITLSIGIYNTDSPDISLEEAIDIADKTMYMAKTKGKDRIETYNSHA